VTATALSTVWCCCGLFRATDRDLLGTTKDMFMIDGCAMCSLFLSSFVGLCLVLSSCLQIPFAKLALLALRSESRISLY
jgi:hypothetical protein